MGILDILFGDQLTRIERKLDYLIREIKEIKLAGPKEQAALDELKAAREALESALERAEEWNSAEDENDAAAIQAEVAKVQGVTQRVANLVGVPANPPGTVVDGTTGEVRPVEPAPAEEPADEESTK